MSRAPFADSGAKTLPSRGTSVLVLGLGISGEAAVRHLLGMGAYGMDLGSFIADVYVLFARTGEAPGAKGLSAFLLPADTPGLTLAELVPHRGTASALALMVNYYVDVVTRRPILAPVRWATISALNVVGLAGDRVRRLGYPNQDTLIHNFLVVCTRDS